MTPNKTFCDISTIGVQDLQISLVYIWAYFILVADPMFGSSNSAQTILHLLKPGTLKSGFFTTHGLDHPEHLHLHIFQ